MKPRAPETEVGERPSEAINGRYIDVTRRARARSIFPPVAHLVLERRGRPILGRYAQGIGCARRVGRAQGRALAGAFGIEGVIGHSLGKRSARSVLVSAPSEPSTPARPPMAIGREYLPWVIEELPLDGIRRQGGSLDRQPAEPSQHRVSPAALANIRRALRGIGIEEVELLCRAARMTVRK